MVSTSVSVSQTKRGPKCKGLLHIMKTVTGCNKLCRTEVPEVGTGNRVDMYISISLQKKHHVFQITNLSTQSLASHLTDI